MWKFLLYLYLLDALSAKRFTYILKNRPDTEILNSLVLKIRK